MNGQTFACCISKDDHTILICTERAKNFGKFFQLSAILKFIRAKPTYLLKLLSSLFCSPYAFTCLCNELCMTHNKQCFIIREAVMLCYTRTWYGYQVHTYRQVGKGLIRDLEKFCQIIAMQCKCIPIYSDFQACFLRCWHIRYMYVHIYNMFREIKVLIYRPCMNKCQSALSFVFLTLKRCKIYIIFLCRPTMRQAE